MNIGMIHGEEGQRAVRPNRAVKFLVVDDSPTMRRIVNRSLHDLGFKEIIEAEDGRDAMAKLAAEDIDFIITDWNMPHMDGLALTEAVRKHEAYRTLPILMVTTRSNKRDVVRALRARVDSYLTKPFAPESLQEKVLSLLEGQDTEK